MLRSICSYELVDRFAQHLDGFFIPLAHSIHNAMLHMILQDYLADVVYGSAHRCQLHQYLTAIAPALDHVHDRCQMTIEPRDAVQNGLCLRVTVVMTMRAMDTLTSMAVLDDCAIGQHVLMYMFVAMFVQTTLSLLLPLFYIIRFLVLFSCSRHENIIASVFLHAFSSSTADAVPLPLWGRLLTHQGTVFTVP